MLNRWVSRWLGKAPGPGAGRSQRASPGLGRPSLAPVKCLAAIPPAVAKRESGTRGVCSLSRPLALPRRLHGGQALHGRRPGRPRPGLRAASGRPGRGASRAAAGPAFRRRGPGPAPRPGWRRGARSRRPWRSIEHGRGMAAALVEHSRRNDSEVDVSARVTPEAWLVTTGAVHARPSGRKCSPAWSRCGRPAWPHACWS